MKKAPKTKRDPEMLDEYDFSKGVRGKYAQRYAEGSNIVVLAPDVAEHFPDSDSVNEALRALVRLLTRPRRLACRARGQARGRQPRAMTPVKDHNVPCQRRWPAVLDAPTRPPRP